MTIYRCQNCDWTTTEAGQMQCIKDFAKRHEPGDAVADGECPECGALCFEVKAPTTEDNRKATQAIATVARQQWWNANSLGSLYFRFIEEQGLLPRLAEFVVKQANEENSHAG